MARRCASRGSVTRARSLRPSGAAGGSVPGGRDDYGGPPENRVRLLLEVVDAVAAAWSAGRVGVQVSPLSPLNDMSDPDPFALFRVVAERLSPVGLAYLHVYEPIGPDSTESRVSHGIRASFAGPLVLNGGYDRGTATRAIADGEADLISFGRPFIANPDLPERLARGAPLRTPDPGTFYGGDATGYTDYATLAEESTEESTEE